MAHKRMFSQDIVSSDAFLEMPISCQALYFHLGMSADDDGFVNPKKIMRMIGSTDDDLKILLGKRFLLTFESGVVVIKHWIIHNAIRPDRYIKTTYSEELKSLRVKSNKSYTENKVAVIDSSGIPDIRRQDGGKMTAQYRIEENRRVEIPEQSSETLKKIGGPFILEEYLEKMKKDQKIHVRLIGYFIKRKGLTPSSIPEMVLAIQRWSKVAKQITDVYGQEQGRIEKAVDRCIEKHSDVDWGLDTVLRKLINTPQ